MPYEENVLALLAHGETEAEHTEALRQARYKSEDAARVVARAQEDALVAQGAKDRAAKKAEMEAAIAARGMTPDMQLASQADRISNLEKMIEARELEAKPVKIEPKLVPA